MKDFEFRVDDRVVITDPGKLYDTFWPMRKAWGFDCGDNGLGSFTAEKNDMGTIVHCGYHYTFGNPIYGVELDNGEQIIIGADGISPAPEDQLEALIDTLSTQSDVFSIETIRETARQIRNQYPNL